MANKLSNENVSLIDKILLDLKEINGFNCTYSILSTRITELTKENKNEVIKLVELKNICNVKYLTQENIDFKLTDFALDIIKKYSSYKKYLENISEKEKRENEMYENSKTTLELTKATFDLTKKDSIISKKSFCWTKWNTIFVIIAAVIGAASIYIALHGINI